MCFGGQPEQQEDPNVEYQRAIQRNIARTKDYLNQVWQDPFYSSYLTPDERNYLTSLTYQTIQQNPYYGEKFGSYSSPYSQFKFIPPDPSAGLPENIREFAKNPQTLGRNFGLDTAYSSGTSSNPQGLSSWQAALLSDIDAYVAQKKIQQSSSPYPNLGGNIGYGQQFNTIKDIPVGSAEGILNTSPMAGTTGGGIFSAPTESNLSNIPGATDLLDYYNPQNYKSWT